MSATETGSARRALSVIVMLLGLALIGAAVFVLLTMNGDDVPPESTPPAADDAIEDPEEPAEPEEPQPPVTVTYELLITRDPFAPVRPEPEPDEDEDADETDPTDSDEDPANGEEAEDVEDGEELDNLGTPADLSIVVLETTSDSAVIQVGDTVFDRDVGETFADGRYQLTAIVDGCARIRDNLSGSVRTICPTESGFK